MAQARVRERLRAGQRGAALVRAVQRAVPQRRQDALYLILRVPLHSSKRTISAQSFAPQKTLLLCIRLHSSISDGGHCCSNNKLTESLQAGWWKSVPRCRSMHSTQGA